MRRCQDSAGRARRRLRNADRCERRSPCVVWRHILPSASHLCCVGTRNRRAPIPGPARCNPGKRVVSRVVHVALLPRRYPAGLVDSRSVFPSRGRSHDCVSPAIYCSAERDRAAPSGVRPLAVWEGWLASGCGGSEPESERLPANHTQRQKSLRFGRRV